MRATVLLCVLFAFTATAQWVSPIEQSYGPYIAPPLDSQPALVARNDRMLLAWSEVDPVTNVAQIHTGLLDLDGRLVTPITKLPLFSFSNFARTPVAATDGSGFYVAWTEPSAGASFAGIALDANGNPIQQPHFLGHAPATTPKPIAGWSGTHYFAGVDGSPATLDRNGNPSYAFLWIPTGFRYAANGAFFGMTSTSNRQELRCTFWFGIHCVNVPAQLQVKWSLSNGITARNDSTTAAYFGSSVIAGGTEADTAILWRAELGSGDAIHGVRVRNGVFDSLFSLNNTNPLKPPNPDGVAFDGERWLVVMTIDGDIHGAFVDRTGATFDTFVIANSARTESRAQVLALSHGHFFVAYDSDLPNDHRIAGRIVLAETPPKRRAAR